MQIIYISIRPKILSETLVYVDKLMPFLHQIIIITSPNLMDQFIAPQRFKLTVVNEQQMLGDKLCAFKQTQDHVEKNWLLRASIPNLPFLDEDFLLADDDSRPLTLIEREKYISDGKYNTFYYYDARRKRRNKTSYDRALRRTTKILKHKNWPTLAYSAHMPQIFNKQFLREASLAFANEPNQGILEWEAYFNYCHHYHPEKFNQPKPYETLCWPALPTDWLLYVKPNRYSFENFYPELYEKNNLFNSLPVEFHPTLFEQISQEKIRRRLALDHQRHFEITLSQNSFYHSYQVLCFLAAKIWRFLKKKIKRGKRREGRG